VIDFLSNGGYATWVQTIVVLVSVGITYLALRDTDTIQEKQTTIDLARKYYSDQPPPAMALLRLTNAQLDVVAKAKASIKDYNSKADPENAKLFAVVEPMLKARLDGDATLKADYETMRAVYYSVATCIDTRACGTEFTGAMFGPTILRFYNATCPYMKEISTDLSHVNDNSNMLDFLQNAANIADQSSYLCRDEKK
jgi:hypothetical protein